MYLSPHYVLLPPAVAQADSPVDVTVGRSLSAHSMSIRIKDIAFTAYPSTDIPRSRKFYTEILDLKETMAADFGCGKWWVEYEIGAGTLAISNYTNPSPTGDGANIALEVEDLDEALADLRAKGIKIEEIIPGTPIMESPVCRFAFIKDPDGTFINLHQHK